MYTFLDRLPMRSLSSSMCQCINQVAAPNEEENYLVIFPKQRVVFTWDHWIIDFDKQLSVEIDTNQKLYNLEKLKDYEPIYLQRKEEKDPRKDASLKKKILYKKGFLMICDNFKDQFATFFCILNIYKQKLKLYIGKEKISTIDLVYAKLELKRGGFDILTSKLKRLNVKTAQDAGPTSSLYEWYLSLYNSIQINMPDKVDFKIEPRNGTMEITFYQQKRYFDLNKDGANKKGLLNFDEDGIPYQINRTNYEVNIKNMIGISIIDDSTSELFSVSLKNTNVVFQIEEKFIKEDDEIEVGYNASATPESKNQQLDLALPIAPISLKRQVIKHVTKTFLQFSLENIFINNQDIQKSQYPVIFASDIKKNGDKPLPFIFISASWKNVKNVYEQDEKVLLGAQNEVVQSGGRAAEMTFSNNIPQNGQLAAEIDTKPSKKLPQSNPGTNEIASNTNIMHNENITQTKKTISSASKSNNALMSSSNLAGSQLPAASPMIIAIPSTNQIPIDGNNNNPINNPMCGQSFKKFATLSLDETGQDDLESVMSLVDGETTSEQVVQWINNLQIYFDHFEIRIDQQIISTITSFTSQLNKALNSTAAVKLAPIQTILDELTLNNIDVLLYQGFSSNKNNKKKAIYFKNLSIQPINFCLTLNLTGGSSSNTPNQGYAATFRPLAIFSEFGLELVAIDQANISLKALNQQHLYDTLPSIQSRIQKHYISQFLTELYKIFGSFEAIGNPVKLVKDISSSAKKMIYNPLKSLAKGSGAQAVGDLATGAISFVQNSISGVYKAIRNITGFIMRVISKVTLHKQYLQDRSIRINRQIKNIEDGFFIGGKNLALILWETIYGVIYLPLEGCRQNHILGFILGTYTAFVSVFIKPLVGIYDFLISMIDGIFNSALYEDHIMENRSRPPRVFENQKIDNFDYKMAVGKDILRRLKQQPKSYETIKYYDEIQIKSKRFQEIVLTDIRLVCAKKNSPVDFQKVMLHKIKYIEYIKKRRAFRFYYDVPLKKLLKCCSSKNPHSQVKYEKGDNHEKAMELIRHLKEHYRIQNIPIKIVIKET